MTFIASSLYFFLSAILSLVLLMFIAYMILSWLFVLNIVSPNNPTARRVQSILSSFVEPILNPIRRFVPPLGGLDLAFFIAFVVVVWVKNFVLPLLLTV